MLKTIKEVINRARYKWLVVKMYEYIYYKLVQNAHKDSFFSPGWEKVTTKELLTLLKKEVHELEEAIATKNDLWIKEEAVDVATFASMIVDKHDGLSKPRR